MANTNLLQGYKKSIINRAYLYWDMRLICQTNDPKQTRVSWLLAASLHTAHSSHRVRRLLTGIRGCVQLRQ